VWVFLALEFLALEFPALEFPALEFPALEFPALEFPALERWQPRLPLGSAERLLGPSPQVRSTAVLSSAAGSVDLTPAT
jgi:hypothetical protein